MSHSIPELSPRYDEALRLASSLVEDIRALSKTFPETEDMGLIIDIRQAVMDLHSAVMMAATSAQREDFFAYTNDTRGKGARLRTYLHMAYELGYCALPLRDELAQKLDRLGDLMELPAKPDLRIV